MECAKLLMTDGLLRERMGRNGRTYVRDNYHWDVIMQKYDRLIAALARSKPGGAGATA